MKRYTAFLVFLIFVSVQAISQQDESAYLNKVQTLDGTLETLYGVISGEKDEARNWNLFNYLFVPTAQLMPIQRNEDERWAPKVLTVEEYIATAGAWLEKNGFYEKEIHRVVETYGPLTHVFSTYESYYSQKDNAPFARGINSIQLLYDDSRWWVVSIYWFGETEEYPIPAAYLPND
jgi:hypothetical protein